MPLISVITLAVFINATLFYGLAVFLYINITFFGNLTALLL